MKKNQQVSDENIVPLYQKPKTSLFLDAQDIKGGTLNVPESNNGVLLTS